MHRINVKLNVEKWFSKYAPLNLSSIITSDGSGPNFFGLGQAQQLTVWARASSGF